MKLELYYYDTCPYCKKVIHYLSDNNFNNVILKNIIKNSEYKKELIKLNNSTQVPCLTIDGKPILESIEIINFLKKNL